MAMVAWGYLVFKWFQNHLDHMPNDVQISFT